MKRYVLAHVVLAAALVIAASDQDVELDRIFRVAQHDYVGMYGRESESQLARAIAERAEQFVEQPIQTVFRSHGDIRNLPVFPPDFPKTLYRAWWSMRGFAPYRPVDIVPRSSLDAGNYEELKKIYEAAHGCVAIVAPTCAVLCAASDAMRRSYSLPPFGVVIFDASACAEEYAHFFNWSPPGSPATGFTQESFNEVASWGEFKAAYRGLKLDAWRLGFDVGEQGGMDAYVACINGDVQRVTTNSWVSGFTYETNIVEIAYEISGGVAMVTNVTQVDVWSHEIVVHDDGQTFQQRVPANSFALFHAYLEARAAAGTESDNADYERLRAWMTSAAVGRKIL